MGADKFSFDVFLSYSKKDQLHVRRLAERLRAAGVTVWFDEWLIQPGDDIHLAVERGLETSRTLILCMSPNAFNSDWVTLERGTTLFRDPTNRGRRFIPLLLADCTVPDTVRRYKYVDFRVENDAAFQELLAVCRAGAESVPPPDPRRKLGGKKPMRAGVLVVALLLASGISAHYEHREREKAEEAREKAMAAVAEAKRQAEEATRKRMEAEEGRKKAEVEAEQAKKTEEARKKAEAEAEQAKKTEEAWKKAEAEAEQAKKAAAEAKHKAGDGFN